MQRQSGFLRCMVVKADIGYGLGIAGANALLGFQNIVRDFSCYHTIAAKMNILTR
jgi:hypothetical protein